MTWKLECVTDVKELIYNFGDLHPKNYDVKNDSGSIEIKVKGNVVFDFEKETYLLKLSSDEDPQ